MPASSPRRVAVSPRRRVRASPCPRVGPLLFAACLVLYLLTTGGHGYSADGQFAFTMGKSLWLDPARTYFQQERRGLSHWGIATPVLLGPWLLAGDVVARLAPQQDQLVVDGQTFLLEQWPVAGRTSVDGPPPPSTYEIPVRPRPASPVAAVELISFLALADQVPQGTEVARLTLHPSDGPPAVLPLRAGMDTAEWAHDRVDVRPRVRHERARVVGRWVGDPVGLHYFARVQLPSPTSVERLIVEYTAAGGQLHLRALQLVGESRGGAAPRLSLQSGERFWSERENRDYFLRLFTSTFNAFVTAGSVCLVFAVVGLLGYPRPVSLAVAALYGSATLAWPYARYDFAEPLVGFFLLLALYGTLRRQRGGSLLWLPAASLALAGAIATKYATFIVLPAFVLHVAVRGGGEGTEGTDSSLRSLARDLAAFAAPLVLLGTPALVLVFGRLGVQPTVLVDALGGLQRGWLDLPAHIGLRGLLLSPGKSWLLYAPPLVLAALGVPAFVRRHGARAAIFYLVPLTYLLVYGMKGIWYGGSTWGPRYLVPATAFLILGAAPLVARAWAGRRWARALVVAAFVLGVAAQGLGIAKDFSKYVDLFRLQVAPLLVDDGVGYGGADFAPWARGQAEGNLTATLFAPPFSPLLGHAWLLGADAIRLALPQRADLLQKALATPPWRFWGIYVQPPRPDYGLGLDFWSVRLYLHYASHPAVVAAMWATLLGFEALLILLTWRLLGSLAELPAGRRRRAQWTAAVVAVVTVVLFDTMHLLL